MPARLKPNGPEHMVPNKTKLQQVAVTCRCCMAPWQKWRTCWVISHLVPPTAIQIKLTWEYSPRTHCVSPIAQRSRACQFSNWSILFPQQNKSSIVRLRNSTSLKWLRVWASSYVRGLCKFRANWIVSPQRYWACSPSNHFWIHAGALFKSIILGIYFKPCLAQTIEITTISKSFCRSAKKTYCSGEKPLRACW